MENKVENFKISLDTKEGDCCPECNANWDGGDILQYYKDVREDETHELYKFYKDLSDDELIKGAKSYGWTEETPRRFALVIGMELSLDDPEHYDGVSYFMCPECNIAWNRWSGHRTDRFVKPFEEHKLGQDMFRGVQENAANNKKEEDMSD